MNARVWILALSILAIVPVHSQSSADQSISSQKTVGKWNGRFWRTLGTPEKFAFIAGYSNAVEAVLALTISDFDQFARTREVFLPKLTIEEMARALDRFYETPENGPIGLVNAFHVVSRRASGDDDATIAKLVNEMRASAAKAK